MKERKRRPTPPLSESWLRQEALRHLQRWTSSEWRVRRLLWKRVRRAWSFHGGTEEEAAPMVEAVIAWLVQGRHIDDARFARAWVETLRRRGTSRKMILHKLREKGVPFRITQEALQVEDDLQEEDAEHASAAAYARRRRLGPHRFPVDDSWDRKRKDLASMARAGFSYGVARSVLEG